MKDTVESGVKSDVECGVEGGVEGGDEGGVESVFTPEGDDPFYQCSVSPNRELYVGQKQQILCCRMDDAAPNGQPPSEDKGL